MDFLVEVTIKLDLKEVILLEIFRGAVAKFQKIIINI